MTVKTASSELSFGPPNYAVNLQKYRSSFSHWFLAHKLQYGAQTRLKRGTSMRLEIKCPEFFDCKKQPKEIFYKPNIVNNIRRGSLSVVAAQLLDVIWYFLRHVPPLN